MSNSRLGNNLGAFLKAVARDPKGMVVSQFRQGGFLRGVAFAKGLPAAEGARDEQAEAGPSNPLREYFEANKQGPGIFKWLHYFEIYNRHLAKFRDKDLHIVEIGVSSGGSLGMWRSYFGPRSRITGVDVMPSTKCYENEYTKIVIGDQADRSFWKRFRDEHPPADIVIDDGGHTSEQQIATLEELLPYMNPGGVFICEDVHITYKVFTAFASGLDDALNAFDVQPEPLPGDMMTVRPTPFQQRIHSIHHYPFVVVIETNERPATHLRAVRRGSEWQPWA